MKFIPTLGFLLCLASCQDNQHPNQIVSRADLIQYLENDSTKALQRTDEEIAFWAQRPASSITFTKIASLRAGRFQLSGDPADLRISDSLLLQVNSNYGITPESLQMLAGNAITQHKFLEAKAYIDQAMQIGDRTFASLMMSADIDLELGNHGIVKQTMSKFTNRNSFAYLVRQSKIKDGEGNLDSSIILMEQALTRASYNQSLHNWTLSNLADMYGHADKILLSYRSHLKVLENDPEYYHSLKAIAWIAYSHDHNPALAKEITTKLMEVHPIPDYHLLLAEIATMESDLKEASRQYELFLSKAETSKYGSMYAKYVSLLYSEKISNTEQAIAIALDEIARRPSPQSYDLLAWGHYQAGAFDEALSIVERQLVEASSEPEILYHIGSIYQANGNLVEAEKYLAAAKEGSFELGPEIATLIDLRLKQL